MVTVTGNWFSDQVVALKLEIGMRVRSPSVTPNFQKDKKMSKTDKEKCCGCGDDMPDENIVDGHPTWFGSFKNDKLIEFVCWNCYRKGIGTEMHKRAKDKIVL